jgi:hypothetical protein
MFSTAFTYMAAPPSGSNLWTPAQISTAFWVDADDISTITLSGSNVTQWNDKSGNGNNAVQATPAKQPAYSSTGFNSKPSVNFFNGSQLIVSTGTFGPNISMFSAVKLNTGLSFYIRLINISATADQYGFLGALNNNFATFFGSGSSWNDISVNSPAVSVTSNNILEVVNPTSGSDATPYVNGIAQNAKVGTMGTATGLQLSEGGGQSWEGPVAEIVIVNSGVSTTVRQQIEGYLAWKWGLEGNLPNDHPYKNSPPTI